MKKISILLTIVTVLALSSCSKKGPDLAISIPDNAVAVVSLHPMKIHSKGQLNSFESLKEKAKDEIWGMILEDPMSTGLMLNEYAYVFATMEEEAPVIGFVAGMKDKEKFQATLGKIDEDILGQRTEKEGYSFIQPDEEGIIAWSEEKVIILGSPDSEEFEKSYWENSLQALFHPVKEESISSLVDFKDFQGKMQDINLWLSAGDIGKIIEKMSDEDMKDLMINLDHNYTHMYCEFANGVMNVSGESNFSEDVQKNLDEVLVLNPSLNKEILKMTPGGDLLLAVAFSMDLEKVNKLVEKYGPDDMGEVGDKVEEATGIPADKLLQHLTGDFTLAVNGLEGENMIPVELFIGVGVRSDELQKQLMENVESMVPVEEEGDFFTINVQGTEIYSGILHDTWVLTNVKDYKESAKKGSLNNSLLDSKFAEFAEGSVGIYLNLDLDRYPELVTDLLDDNPEEQEQVEKLTAHFDYLGLTAGEKQSQMILKTNTPAENSLYTILKMIDSGK